MKTDKELLAIIEPYLGQLCVLLYLIAMGLAIWGATL